MGQGLIYCLAESPEINVWSILQHVMAQGKSPSGSISMREASKYKIRLSSPSIAEPPLLLDFDLEDLP